MKNTLKLILLLSILMVTQGVTLSQTTPQKFFDALVYDKASITDYVNKDELEKSNRLGITYTGITSKFFLGYELPEEIKEGIRSGKYKYDLMVENHLNKDASARITINVTEAKFSKEFYYKKGIIANTTFYSKYWQKKESKYFRFSIEEPKYFNDYCIKRLDDFVDMIADTLGFTITEKRILEQQKLGYIFCADEKGVEKITGFSAKGLAMLGTDEVVTSYQTHFHEVAHLLINYKLKTLGLYTLPFFMEGFAVAVGGRGGMAPRVVTDLGYYLQKTGELTYDSIFTFDQFKNIDGSMTYPVAGLFNSFLLSDLGGEKYLELYRKVNGDLEYVKNLNMNSISLPDNYKWQVFLDYYKNNPNLYIDDKDTLKIESHNAGNFKILNNGYVKFSIPQYIFVDFLINNVSNSEYSSKLFFTTFPQDSLSWSYVTQYIILADSNSLKVIDFLNDELIFSYNKNLSIDNFNIPEFKNRYEFFINGSIFKLNESKGYTINNIILKSLYYK